MESVTSLYDFMVKNGHDGGCDCYDPEYDYPQLCIIPITEEKDTYDVMNNWILRNTEFKSAGKEPGIYTEGDFAKLVRDHFEQFKRFTAEHNKEDYRVTDDSEDSIYNGCVTIHCLEAGRYADDDYDDFCTTFGLVPEGYAIVEHRIVPKGVE